MVLAELINFDYKEEQNSGVFHASCYTRDNKRWFIAVRGKKIIPEFGVPYDEFWKLLGNEYMVGYSRAPDSPLGEPVMNVVTKLPRHVAGHQDSLISLVSHSYYGDVKFEKKCLRSLGITEGYFDFDPSKIDELGYIDSEFVNPPDPKEEKFDALKKKFYADTEWDMSALVNVRGEFRGAELADGDFKQSIVLTMSFLDSQKWTFDVFTWHPKASESTFVEEYISRMPEETRKKLQRMPVKYSTTVHAYTGERAMLACFLDWFSRDKDAYPDCMIGHNFCGGIHGKGKDKRWYNGFDMPWLYQRLEYLDLPVNRLSPIGDCYFRYGVPRWSKTEVVIKLVSLTDTWHGVEYFDVTARESEIKNQKLGTLIKHFLKVGKVEYDYPHVWDLWREHPKEERLYNQADTEGCCGLDEMFMMSEDEFNRALFCGAKWEDGREASKLHDQINLRLYNGLYSLDTKYQFIRGEDGKEIKVQAPSGKKHRIPWKRDWVTNISGMEGDADNDTEDYFQQVSEEDTDDEGNEKVGGHVEDAEIGMHDWVAVGDFAGFYPATSIGTNCGPETFINVIQKSLDSVLDKRPFLKHEVSDWNDYLEKIKWRLGPGGKLQDIITDDLIGWKETWIPIKDLVNTPGGYYKKAPVAKNVVAFKELKAKRKPLQKKAKSVFKEVKDYWNTLFKIWDRKQFSFKGLTNARFGVTGMSVDRLFMIQIFNTITLTAQQIIIEVIRFLREDLKYRIVGGDTDSIFIKLKITPPEWITVPDDDEEGKTKITCKEIQELDIKINEHIRKYAKEAFNIDDTSMFSMSIEDINDFFLIVTKKHYIKRTIWKEGTILPEPKPGDVRDKRIFFKGVKRVRRDSAIYSAYVQDELSMIAMAGKPKNDIVSKCVHLHENVRKQQIENLCKTIALGRSIDSYTKSSEQWKAFTFANEFFNAGFTLGSRAFCVRLKYCPVEIDKRKIPRDVLGDVIAFVPEMIPAMLKCKMEFDWYELEDFAIAGPADEILKGYGTTYWKVVNDAKTFDATEW